MLLSRADSLQSPVPLNHAPYIKRSQLKPLTRQFFGNLIKLELDLMHQDYTIDTLNELTTYYGAAVEYYSAFQDEIASYFVFKIQDALAMKKSLKILMDQSTSGSAENALHSVSPGKSGSPITKPQRRVSFSDTRMKNEIIQEKCEESDEEEEKDMVEIEKRRQMMQANKKLRRSMSKMNNKNQKCVMLFHKLEQEKKNDQQNLNKTLDSFKDSSKGNDGLILKDIESQKDRIRERIQQRKHNSFASFAHGTSFGTIGNKTMANYSFTLPEKRDQGHLEYVLGELENFDEFEFDKDMDLSCDLDFNEKPKQSSDSALKMRDYISKRRVISLPDPTIGNKDREEEIMSTNNYNVDPKILRPIQNLENREDLDSHKNLEDGKEVFRLPKTLDNNLASNSKMSNKENASLRYL